MPFDRLFLGIIYETSQKFVFTSGSIENTGQEICAGYFVFGGVVVDVVK